jgi:hypothetical protein
MRQFHDTAGGMAMICSPAEHNDMQSAASSTLHGVNREEKRRRFIHASASGGWREPRIDSAAHDERSVPAVRPPSSRGRSAREND